MTNDDAAEPRYSPSTRLLFIYPNYGDPDGCPDYTAHTCQIVTIVRPLVYHEEYENMGDPMYKARATDGWEGDIWESELHPIDYDWSTGVDQNGNSIRTPATT